MPETNLQWTFIQSPNRHWNSSPPGYFIVKESALGFTKLYVVYQGTFDDRRLKTGNSPTKMGEYLTLAGAQQFCP